MSEMDQGPVDETWIFGGSRVVNGKKLHAWLPVGSGNDVEDELWFDAAGTHAVVGSEYAVRVTRTTAKTTRHGTPEYRSRHADDETRAILEARHRAAETRLRLLALERNDKRTSALDAALEPLCAIIKATPAPDRNAFMTYVTTKLARSW
jgi:hypothetical protein